MKISSLSLSLFMGVSLLVGCKKSSSDTVTPGNCDNVNALSDKATAAATAYSADPSNKVKCNAYVDAYKGFVDAAIACSTVSQAQRNDIQASYTQARDACK